MTPPTVSLRPATDADVPALELVMLENDTPPGGTPPYGAGAQRPYLAHLVRRGTVVLAEHGGEAAGFGASVDTGRAVHLADLFVRPTLHGSGIGRRLLTAVFGDAPVRTTFASDDPRALPLYVRAGLRAYWPNLYLAGDPRAVPSRPRSYDVERTELETMAGLERAWTGAERAPDVDYWASQPGVRPFVVAFRGRPVATGLGRDRIVGTGRWIGHAAVAPGEDPLPALLAALHAGLSGSDVGGGCIPGPSPIVRPLLEAGFRIIDRDTFLATDPGLVDPEREIVSTGFL